jgi:hypothetical protein
MVVLLISLLLSAATMASSRKVQNYDLTGDGKPNLVRIYQNNLLIEQQDDLDLDGTLDQWTFYQYGTGPVFKIVRKRGRETVYWHDTEKKLTFSKTSIDRDGDGKWDHEYITHGPIDQRVVCQTSTPALVQQLADDGLSAVTQLSEFHQTDYGLQVHRSCLGANHEWFNQGAREALAEGASCLAKLAQTGGRGARRNAQLLAISLEKNDVQVLCNDQSLGPGTIAMATVDSSQDNSRNGMRHPAISINPAFMQKVGNGEASMLDFKKTIFHEQLHNLGYRHSHDIEYPYTCESCCFDEGPENAAACRICSGNYEGSTDLAYLRDLTSWGRQNYNLTHGQKASIKYLKENPGSLEGIAYLANNNSDAFNPMGWELANLIKKNNNLSPEEANLFLDMRDYPDLHGPYRNSGKVLAEAYYELYMNGNSEGALKILGDARETIKTQTGPGFHSENTASQYLKSDIRATMRTLLYDIWLDRNVGHRTSPARAEEISTQAWKLVKEFEQ